MNTNLHNDVEIIKVKKDVMGIQTFTISKLKSGYEIQFMYFAKETAKTAKAFYK